MTRTRQDEIEQRTIDLLLDKGTLSSINPNDIKSFSVLLYHSERLCALGEERGGHMKTSAYLLALEHLNLTESEVDNIL